MSSAFLAKADHHGARATLDRLVILLIGERIMLTRSCRFDFVYNSLFRVLLFLALLAPLLNPRPIIAAPQTRIVYVKPGAPEDNSGDSWVTARGLQGALADSVAGDEIWVTAGLYHPLNSGI